MAILDVINEALARAYRPGITSLESTSGDAPFASKVYVNTIKGVQLKGPWSGCQKRATLDLLVDESDNAIVPEYEFTYAYVLPTDFLKLEKFKEGNPACYKFKIENLDSQRVILTDEPTLYITYSAYVSDPDQWGIELTEAIILKLASLFAGINGERQRSIDLYSEYMQIIRENRALSHQQQSPILLYNSEIDNIRNR